MIGGLSVLALITARGGSKGLPGKNLRPLAGQPLVAWSALQAKASKLVDRVVISTDDPAIRDAAVAAGAEAPFLRPIELASDTAGSAEVVRHALDALDGAYDILVLLQPTSPLRAVTDIEACLCRVAKPGVPSCLSVTQVAKPPHWMMSMDADGRLDPLLGATDALRRQDLPKAYVPNGAVYAVRISWFLEHGTFSAPGGLGHLMPADRSVDIDTEADFRYAEFLIERGLADPAPMEPPA